MWRQDMNYETQAATFFLSFLSLIAFHYHLQVTPSLPPVLWPASVARVYLLPTLSFVPLVVVCRAVTWGPFEIYLGSAWGKLVYIERICDVRYSEVDPMKCPLFYQPYMHQLQHPMQWTPVQLHAISKQRPVHALKCSQLNWRAIPEL